LHHISLYQESQRGLEQTIAKNTIRNSNPGREGQNPQLKNIVKDQTFELDTQRKEMDNYKDQIVFMQKEVRYSVFSKSV